MGIGVGQDLTKDADSVIVAEFGVSGDKARELDGLCCSAARSQAQAA